MWQISDDHRLERLVVFAYDGISPIPAGELLFSGQDRRQGRFRYAESWLKRKDSFPLSAVDLPLKRGMHACNGRVPLSFHDAMPDGWGKSIIERAFPHQVFGDAEFLAACGLNRTGALNFGPDPYLAPQRWFPSEDPMLDLVDGDADIERLLNAAAAADDGNPDKSDLYFLFRDSADIGGARPKARVHLDGKSWIAKFPTRDDRFDEAKLEAICLDIARQAGVDTPATKVIEVAGRTVFLIERFDRGNSGERYGYMSAATLVGQNPYEYTTSATYAEVASDARKFGIIPCEEELFRRMLVNAFVHNTDDHLRNHAFLRKDKKWQLSPVFDVVPTGTPRLTLAPGRNISPRPNPASAFEAYRQFKLAKSDAEKIYDAVSRSARCLPDLYDKYKVVSADRDFLAGRLQYALNPPVLA